MKRSQFLIALGTIITATLFGLTLTTTPGVHAASDLGNYKPIFQSKVNYVKVKKPIFTGQYTKINGKKGRPIISKPGTVLQISATGSSKSGNSTAQLTLGDISYTKSKRIYESGYSTKKFTTAYFKPWKLKLPIRTMPFQRGTNFVPSGATNYQPMFVITMDGYLQYYSNSRLKHYHILSSVESNGDARLSNIKPTQARKVATYKVRGNTSYLYLKHPMTHLKAQRVSERYYRIAIRKTSSLISKDWHSGENFVDASWIRYSVNQTPYFSVTNYDSGD